MRTRAQQLQAIKRVLARSSQGKHGKDFSRLVKRLDARIEAASPAEVAPPSPPVKVKGK